MPPPGRPERWLTPAFEPSQRDGRLFGRGAVDDKGTITHVAAVGAWLATAGRLPLNIKLLIEGEEEIGSPGLAGFLRRYGPRLAADVAVLADTGNFDVGHPALTYQLRGICQVDVEVRCLRQPVHSGFFGGPGPDAVRILARLIADLERPDGSLNVPGLYRRVARTPSRQLRRIRALPFDAALNRAAGQMLIRTTPVIAVSVNDALTVELDEFFMAGTLSKTSRAACYWSPTAASHPRTQESTVRLARLQLKPSE